MKLNLRQATWAIALAITFAVLGAPNFAAAFQSQEGRGHDNDRDQGGDREYTRNRNYQRGLSDGREDGAKNRDRQYRLRTNNDADRRAYQAGYDQGYQDTRRGNYDRNRGQNDNYNSQNSRQDRNGPYGRNDNLAAQMGAQDGLNDGRKDRATGHSNRPTQGDNYKNATRGFAGGAGQTAYKAAYRQAYVPAYQQGYNEQNSGRR